MRGKKPPFNPPKFKRKEQVNLNKNSYFSFRVSEEEKKKIDKKIEKSKLRKSDFLRKTVLEKEIIQVEGFKELAIELSRLGNNINQIAKAINLGKLEEVEEIKKLESEYKKVFEEILRISKKV